MKWLDVSEMVAGMIIQEEISPDAVTPGMLHPPFDVLIRGLQQKKELSEMIQEVGYRAIGDARVAASAVDTALPINWLRQLEISAARAQASDTLRRASRKLERGEEADMAEVMRVLRQSQEGYQDLAPLSKTDPATKIWVPTFYRPIDKYIGGIPDAGLTTVGGPPGTGKTGLAIKILTKIAKRKKKGVLFSLEMTRAQIAKRQLEIEASSEKTRSYILVSEAMLNIDQIYARASSKASEEDIYLIVIDFADMVIKGESGTSSMEYVYRTCKALAKNTGVPVMLLAQLNEKYTGGIPKVNHLRWSRLAEALSDLILLIYNPDQLWADVGSDTRLSAVEGAGYIIVGKSKFGLNTEEENVYGIGAIQVAWDGKASWGDRALGWFSLTQGG